MEIPPQPVKTAYQYEIYITKIPSTDGDQTIGVNLTVTLFMETLNKNLLNKLKQNHEGRIN